jgi:hypothetical protein
LNIFKTEIKVNGNVVTGEIIQNKFYMNNIKPAGENFSPIPTRAFNKNQLELYISELKAISDKLDGVQTNR